MSSRRTRRTGSSRSARSRRANRTYGRATARERAVEFSAFSRAKRNANRNLAAIRKQQWQACKELERQIDRAYNKLRTDVQRHVNVQTVIRDRSHLMFLLGRSQEKIRSSGKRNG